MSSSSAMVERGFGTRVKMTPRTHLYRSCIAGVDGVRQIKYESLMGNLNVLFFTRTTSRHVCAASRAPDPFYSFVHMIVLCRLTPPVPWNWEVEVWPPTNH